MSRKKKRIERNIFPDFLYKKVEVSKFINLITYSGKKYTASKILYKSFEYVKKILKKDPLEIFSKAINNIAPMFEVKLKKFGNFSSFSPVEISDYRRINLAMNCLKNSSRKRKEKFMYLKLGKEIIDSYKKISFCYKKKFDFQKISNSNRFYLKDE